METKECKDFEEFCSLICDAKEAKTKVTINGKTVNKNKIVKDFDDLFYNGVKVVYFFDKNVLHFTYGDRISFNLIKKLKNEGRSKRWFIENFTSFKYSTASAQIGGFNKLSKEMIKAINKYLES